MSRLMPLFLVVALAMASCNQPSTPPAPAAAPASPFAGWSTPDALRARLPEKVELSEMESDGETGPPPSPWSQATELTEPGASLQDLTAALREEVLARVQDSPWRAA